jgi:hypothetical protein
MIEYAIISGQNFLNLIGPTLAPLRNLYAKVGLSLSVAETCFLTLILVGLIIVSLYFLAVKR